METTPQPINRPQELSEHIETLIGEYAAICPQSIDFFDILEALALTGVRALYKDAVEHPQPIFTDQQFKSAANLVSDVITKALNDREQPFTPVVELIGLVTNLAHLSRWHNQKIKEYVTAQLASSEAEAATTTNGSNENSISE